MGLAVPPFMAFNCAKMSLSSLGECSMSNSNQSKPAPAKISVLMGLHRCDHKPIWG